MVIVSESEVGTSGPLRCWLGNIEVPDECRGCRDLFAEPRGIGREINDPRVARRVELSRRTVKSYLSSAMPRLEAGSRYEALVSARRAGLLP
jgi:hypothetical protein